MAEDAHCHAKTRLKVGLGRRDWFWREARTKEGQRNETEEGKGMVETNLLVVGVYIVAESHVQRFGYVYFFPLFFCKSVKLYSKSNFLYSENQF